jgi:hypothetical protein
LADVAHEFLDAEPLAVGKDYRSVTPNPEVTNEGYVANDVKSLKTNQQFFDGVGLNLFHILGQRTCEFAVCGDRYSSNPTLTSRLWARR